MPSPQSPAPTPAALRMDLCKHYPGVTAESCRAGQRYEDVAAAADHWDGYGSEPLNARLPCCIRNEHRDHACGKRRLPTINEIREGERAVSYEQ